MFGNYLGIRSGGASGDKNKPGPKYARVQDKATPSTRCQKCMGMGHFTYECKGEREYKPRPTRTQILENPKLRAKLLEREPARMEDMPKEGTAAGILAMNEEKRAAKAKAAAKANSRSSSSSSSSGSSSGSSSSGSSSSGSGSGSESESEDERDRSTTRRRRRSESRESEGKKRRTDDGGKGKGRAIDQDA